MNANNKFSLYSFRLVLWLCLVIVAAFYNSQLNISHRSYVWLDMCMGECVRICNLSAPYSLYLNRVWTLRFLHRIYVWIYKRRCLVGIWKIVMLYGRVGGHNFALTRIWVVWMWQRTGAKNARSFGQVPTSTSKDIPPWGWRKQLFNFFICLNVIIRTFLILVVRFSVMNVCILLRDCGVTII